MDQLLWAPFFLSTIVAAQFSLEVGRYGTLSCFKALATARNPVPSTRLLGCWL